MLCALLAAAGSGEFSPAHAMGPNQAQQQLAVAAIDGSWASLPAGMPEITKQGMPAVRPKAFTAWVLDRDAVNKTLATAPAEALVARQAALPTEIELPMPDGKLERFAISEVTIMEPGLAAKIPTYKTFAGRGVDDSAKSIRCEMTDLGFTAQILTPEGVFFIEPYNQFDQQFYASYRKSVLEAPDFRCGVDGNTLDNNPINAQGAPALRLRGSSVARTNDTRKTYRLAIATTPQFTSTNGGDAATLARIVVMANRLNQIYTQDFNIGLTLVANNDTIIYNTTTNIPGSAYNQASASSMLTTNQTNLTARIGAANYDIGHVVGAVALNSENGIAGAIGNVCTTTKGQGVSLGSNTPADEFVVDYVAHEMGHQFGGRHLFNSCGGSQGDSSTIAVEPGSGITIMCYAGICGATDDIAPHSIAYFNSVNIDQIVAYTTSGAGTCFAGNVTGNTAPVPNAGLDYTIPPSTPYILTGSATDANPGDTLSYSWEQNDGGSVRSLSTTSGTALNSGPLVIPRIPSASPSRAFPPLANLLANTLNNQDLLPPAARTMNFRFTARDGNGGVDTDNMVLTISGATPFAVTNPNTAAAVNAGSFNVTWNAGTTASAPFNSPNVRITLSTDGGNTFPTVLAASTPNTGSALVTIPNITTSTARIRIESIGNIFFDISNVNFSIVPPLTSPNFLLGVRTTSDAVSNGNNNGVLDPGESNIAVTVQVSNTGVPATTVIGTLSSLTATASVTPASANQAYANIASGSSGSNIAPYILVVDPSHPCGSPINLRLTVNADLLTTAQTFDFAVPTGTGGTGAPVTFTYSGPVVAIPDNNAAGANATIVVSGLTGNISRVQFRFTGAACTAAIGATTVGLNHTWVGDLIGTLRHPDATSVIMFNRIGVSASSTVGNSGNNFCQTLFDDAATTSIQSFPASSAGEPFTGTFAPANPLAGFNGRNPNGTWTLNVADRAGADTGSIRSFELIITTTLPPTCTPPLVVATRCNPADVAGSGATYDSGTGTVDVGPDLALTIEDFAIFLAAFSDATGCPGSTPCNPADITGSGATYNPSNGTVDIGPDGELNIDDFVVFLAAFSDATGCQ